ncbi:MAG: TonB-dependent receptor [Thermodesulfobacteriota bacterium]|nr:TonB-dependent receptor [Thermodesulfobacteriota bacterium]
MRQGALTQHLDYEMSWHYDVGIYHRIGENFDTRFVVYYTDVSDYIALDRDKYYVDDKEKPYAYNVDSAQFYGLELEFNSTLFDKLGLFGNYTYLENEVDETDLPITFWVDIPPRHKGNLGLRYWLKGNILLTCDVRYVGKRKSEDGYTLDDFMITDIGIQYTCLENKAKLLGYVNNVFGENYLEVYGYPMPRQIFGFQLKYIL